MARYTGPKHKLARREGVNILEKQSQSLERRLNVIPGSHSKRRKKFSEYGLQLREKQKLKRIYGLLERQFRRYVEEAQKSQENTEEALMQVLESRLDNILFRLNFAKSRPMARQFVTHRHVMVNGKRVNIPSYRIKPGDVVQLSKGLLEKNPDVQKLIEEDSELLPYLSRKNIEGKIKRLPTPEEIQNPVDYHLVIEFYSR
jgi:small subunit ribosomal protein S4